MARLSRIRFPPWVFDGEACFRPRSFKTPAVWLTAPLAIIGCVYLSHNLPFFTQKFFLAWVVIGLGIYFIYSRPRGYLGWGVMESLTLPHRTLRDAAVESDQVTTTVRLRMDFGCEPAAGICARTRNS